MRKNFLILMLLSLLPLAGWATINVTTAPTLNEGVPYDTTAKQVIKTAGEATGEGTLTFYYAVTTSSSAPGADAADTWYESIDNAKLKVTGVGTYYAYYKVVSSIDTETAIDPTPITGTFAISKVSATVKTAPAAKNLTYNADEQELIVAGASETGTLQYSLTGTSDWATTLPKEKNADTYTVYYKVVGDANHNDLFDAETMKVSVTINKKNLKVKATAFPASKTIFGVFTQSETVTFTYDGWAGSEGVSNITAPTASIAATVKADANCVTINSTKYIKAGNYPDALELTGGSADNYELILLNNDLNIAKANVKVDVKAAPDGAVYGSTAAGKSEWTYKRSETVAAFNIYVQDGLNSDGTPKYSSSALSNVADIDVYLERTGNADANYTYGLKLTRADKSGDKGNYLLAASGATKEANTENITYTNSGSKTFNITAAELTIAVTNKFKTYGEADPKDENGNWAYTVKAGSTTYDGLSAEQTAAIKDALTRAEGETVGDYKISFSEAVKTNDLFKDNYAITWKDGWLTIEKAKLTIKAKEQTLYVGNKVDKLGQALNTNYTVEGLVNNSALEIADEADVKLVFGTTDVATEGLEESAVEVDDAVGKVGELKAHTGAYNYGIKIVLNNADELAANYEIVLVNGKLNVTDPSALLILSSTTDNTEAIAAAAAIDGKKDVKITGRTLSKGQWNVMVLPFKISTLEFCQAIGTYAVFNTLTSANGATVKFSLNLNDLDANVPFLVKPLVDIEGDMEFGDTSDDTDGYIIVNATPTKEVGDAKFIGTYKTLEIPTAAVGYSNWAMQDGKFENLGSDTPSIGFVRAYLLLNTPSEARITVEEADGSTTAISGITADGVAIEADGWYNLNGVKMQGVPTQKGIYIRNGKKIIVK